MASQAEQAPVIGQRHLKEALRQTYGSIPAFERERLQAIYRKFQSSRDPGLGNVQASSKGKGKRVTLA